MIEIVRSTDYKFLKNISYQGKFFLFCFIADVPRGSHKCGIKKLSKRYRISHTYVNSLLKSLCEEGILERRFGYREGRGRTNYIYEFNENLYDAIDLSRALFDGAVEAKKFKELYRVFNSLVPEIHENLNVLERWALLNLVALNFDNVWEDSAEFYNLRKKLNIKSTSHRLKSALAKLSSLGLISVSYSNSGIFSDEKSYIFLINRNHLQLDNKVKKEISKVTYGFERFLFKDIFFGSHNYLYFWIQPEIDANVFIHDDCFGYPLRGQSCFLLGFDKFIKKIFFAYRKEYVVPEVLPRRLQKVHRIASLMLSNFEEHLSKIIEMENTDIHVPITSKNRVKEIRKLVGAMLSDVTINQELKKNIIPQAPYRGIDRCIRTAAKQYPICEHSDEEWYEILIQSVEHRLVSTLFKFSLNVALCYHQTLCEAGYKPSQYNCKAKFSLYTKDGLNSSPQKGDFYLGGVILSEKNNVKNIRDIEFWRIKTKDKIKPGIYACERVL